MFGRRYFGGGQANSGGGGGSGPSASDVWGYEVDAGLTAQEALVAVQAQVLALYRIHGLKIGETLAVTATSRVAGPIEQTIDDNGSTVTVERTV